MSFDYSWCFIPTGETQPDGGYWPKDLVAFLTVIRSMKELTKQKVNKAFY